MNDELRGALKLCETDIDGALNRFCGSEALYDKCLVDFLSDDTINTLDRAIKSRDWDDAFTAAHALKGLAGNMGFVPLFHSSAEMVVLIRAGRVKEIAASYAELRECYRELTDVISKHTAP